MLFQTHFKTILHIFSSIFLAAGMLKTTFSLERVVIFKLFLIFVSDVVFAFYWVHFLMLGDPPGRVSWGFLRDVLRPLGVLSAPLGEALAPRCPQDSPKRPPIAPTEPPKSPKMPPKGPPETTKMPRDAPKTPFKSDCAGVFSQGGAP